MSIVKAYRPYWHPVALVDEVSEKPIRRVLCEEGLVLWKADSGIVVQRDASIHRGALLSTGRVVDSQIEDPYHGWMYDATGACTYVPQMGRDFSIPAHWRLKTYPVRLEGGMVWTCLEDPRAAFPEWLSEMAWNSEGKTSTVIAVMDWATGPCRVMDNILDASHFAVVHDGSFGSRDEVKMPEMVVKTGLQSMKFKMDHQAPVDPEDPSAGVTQMELNYTYHVPFTVLIHQKRPNGDSIYISAIASPVDDHTSRFFNTSVRTFEQSDKESAEMIDYFWPILEEDRIAAENVWPKHIPLEPDSEIHLPSVDGPTIQLRRFLRQIHGLEPAST